MEADAPHAIQHYIEVEQIVEIPIEVPVERFVQVPCVIPVTVRAASATKTNREECSSPKKCVAEEGPPTSPEIQDKKDRKDKKDKKDKKKDKKDRKDKKDKKTTSDQSKSPSRASAEPADSFEQCMEDFSKAFSARIDTLMKEEAQEVTQAADPPQQALPPEEQVPPTTAAAAEQVIQALPNQAEVLVPYVGQHVPVPVYKSQKFVDVPHVEPSQKQVDMPQIETVEWAIVKSVVQKHVHVPMIVECVKEIEVPMVEFISDVPCNPQGAFYVGQEIADKIMAGNPVTPEEISSDANTRPFRG